MNTNPFSIKALWCIQRNVVSKQVRAEKGLEENSVVGRNSLQEIKDC